MVFSKVRQIETDALNKTIRISIATTSGPSDILFLGEEDPAVGRSTMCLNGGAETAGVDAKYNTFVRQPTGIIEKLTGQAAWRMDVGSPIDEGSSWQLGALLAHYCYAADRLSMPLVQPEDRSEIFVLATGSIRMLDQTVSVVDDVPAKIETSLGMLKSKRETGADCVLIIPRGNTADLSADHKARLKNLDVTVLAITSIDQALEELELPARTISRASSASPAQWNKSPYLGLSNYKSQHRQIFFGRESARQDCVERLRTAAAQNLALLLVHGRSGSGKSSLVLAGVVGDIVETATEGGRWQTAILRLSEINEDPTKALIDVFCDVLEVTDRSEFEKTFRDAPANAIQTELLQSESDTLLLTLDQLEQLFVLASGKLLDAFVDTILALARSGCVWIIGTIRTDHLANLERAPKLQAALIDQRLYLLQRPRLAELIEIITAPASMAGYSFESSEDQQAIPEALAEQAIASADSLPLLQIALQRMVASSGANRVLSRTHYDRLGGFEGIVARWADAACSEILSGGVSDETLDHVLLEFIRFDKAQSNPVSRQVDLELSNNDNLGVIEKLVDARILRTDTVRGKRIAGLAHEVLTTHWPRLKQLSEQLSGALALRDQLEDLAEQWKMDGYDTQDLRQPAGRLAAAVELTNSGLCVLSPLTHKFVEAAREHAESETRKEELARRHQLSRTRRTAAVTSVLAALSLVAAVFAYVQWREAGAALDAANEATSLAEVRAAELSVQVALDQIEAGGWEPSLELLVDAAEQYNDTTAPDSILVAFDRALREATHKDNFLIPSSAIPFEIEDRAFFQVPETQKVYEISARGEPREYFRLPGRFFEASSISLGDESDIPIIVVIENEQLKFHRIDLDSPNLQLLSSVDFADFHDVRYEMGPDGIVLLKFYENRDERRSQYSHSLVSLEVLNLASGKRLTLPSLDGDKGILPVLRIDQAGKSVLEKDDFGTINDDGRAKLRSLGVRIVAEEDLESPFQEECRKALFQAKAPRDMIEAYNRYNKNSDAGYSHTFCRVSGNFVLHTNRFDGVSTSSFSDSLFSFFTYNQEITEQNWRPADNYSFHADPGERHFADIIFEGKELTVLGSKLNSVSFANFYVREDGSLSEQAGMELTLTRNLSTAVLLDPQTVVLFLEDDARGIREVLRFSLNSDSEYRTQPLGWSEEVGWQPDFLEQFVHETICTKPQTGDEPFTYEWEDADVSLNEQDGRRVVSYRSGEQVHEIVLSSEISEPNPCIAIHPQGQFYYYQHLNLKDDTKNKFQVYDSLGTSLGLLEIDANYSGDPVFTWDDSPILLTTPRNQLVEHSLNETGDWEQKVLLEHETWIASVSPDPTGNRFALVENRPYQTATGVLWSMSDNMVWRELGDGYKWFFANFLRDGRVFARNGHGTEFSLHSPHSLSQAIQAASNELAIGACKTGDICVDGKKVYGAVEK